MASNVREMLNAALAFTHTNQYEAAEGIGMLKQVFNREMINDTLRFKTFLYVLNYLKLDFSVHDPKSGKDFPILSEGTDIEQLRALDILNLLISNTDCTKRDFAAALDKIAELKQPMQCLNDRLGRDSFKASEFMSMLEIAGFEMVMTDRNTRSFVEKHSRGIGEHVSNVSHGKRYDTRCADALASTFYLNGKDKYTDGMAEELYITEDGEYFVALYEEGKKPKIEFRTPLEAKAFMLVYASNLATEREKDHD